MMIIDARRSKGEPGTSSPSEVPVSPAAAAIGLSRSVALSRGGSLLPGVLCAAGSRGHRVPRSRHGLGIAAGPCGLSPSAVHAALARAASSSRELSASFREQRPATCPSYAGRPHDSPAPKSASHGVPFLIATSAGAVHHSAGSRPTVTFRPRRFSRPRRLTPPPALRVCFAPLPRPGFALQGFVPLREAVPAFRRPRHALLSLGASSCGLTRDFAPSPSGPCSPR